MHRFYWVACWLSLRLGTPGTGILILKCLVPCSSLHHSASVCNYMTCMCVQQVSWWQWLPANILRLEHVEPAGLQITC